MKILTRIYLIVAILLGGIGVLFCARWGLYTFGSLLIFSIIPATLFLILYTISKKFPEKATHATAIPAALFVIIAWGAITLWCELFLSGISTVKDPRKYEHVLLRRWNYDRELISHFPSSIPHDAQNVRFFFRPEFLQGNASIQLRYSTSPDAIETLYGYFSAKKTNVFYKHGTDERMNSEVDTQSTFFYTNDSRVCDDFPKDYEIIILDKPWTSEENDRRHWCNPRHGVAISKERSEIVYWAESW